MCNCTESTQQTDCGKPLPPEPNCKGCIDLLYASCIQYKETSDFSKLTYLNLPVNATLDQILEKIDQTLSLLNQRIQ